MHTTHMTASDIARPINVETSLNCAKTEGTFLCDHMAPTPGAEFIRSQDIGRGFWT